METTKVNYCLYYFHLHSTYMYHFLLLCRWIVVNIVNKTQFSLKFENGWFKHGRFWDAPGSTKAFGCSWFSGCNTALRLEGVSGAALFYLQIPNQLGEFPIAIAFSHPSSENFKIKANFTSDMRYVWETMKQQRSYDDSRPLKDVFVTKNNEKVHVNFKLTADPGQHAKVILTQIYDDKA